MQAPVHNLVNEFMASPECAFSVGGLGAIAEYQDSAPSRIECNNNKALATSKNGAMAIDFSTPVTVLAYESLSAKAQRWQHAIALITSSEQARMASRGVLCELGKDSKALMAEQREDVLFDLGTGLPHIEFCVRTSEPALIRVLRAHCGEHVVNAEHPVIDAIIDASPHRVVRSSAARIEVYQVIDRHQTPAGPHTHLLPDLLQRQRTHSANLPLPGGTVPLLTIHPENPFLDCYGHDRDFVKAPFERFQQVLDVYGDEDYVAAKQALHEAFNNNEEPAQFAPPKSRSGRLGLRIALRQLYHTSAATEAVLRWQSHFKH